MAFTKFTIENFKSFKDKQTLIFAKPNTELEGSGITYIVGANNSGKTTIIEGLSIMDERKIKISERLNDLNPEFLLYEDETLKRKCVLIRPESYTIKEDPRLSYGEKFEIISSRRQWEPNVNGRFDQVGQSMAQSFDFTNRYNSINVPTELKTIENNDVKYAEFIKLVKRVVPEFNKFTIGYEDNEFVEYISGSGTRHKTSLLGDGVITVIRILLHLYVSNGNPLIIDEPELSLHPTAQKKLLKIIAEYSKNRQIILSTHSPYFINWEYLKNGGTLNRVAKTEDINSFIFPIGDFNNYNQLIKAANWQQPYLLDEVAKEIFFTDDNILFLEGQEDVGLLKKESLSSSVNIFGYGVRGKDNFKLALQLAKDLGYKKVACILDNGTSESAIKTELETAFPDYKIIQWNKNDIRDKKSYTSQSKSGYFKESGDKKDVADLDDFEEKKSQINSYFS